MHKSMAGRCRRTAQSTTRCRISTARCRITTPRRRHRPINANVFSQPSIYIDGWLYGMSMTSVVCNVPVLSTVSKRFHISSFCLHDMKVASLRYLDAKFHHPSLGASPPNRGNRISCVQNSRKMENRNSINNSGIGILCSKNSNERLAVPAVAGLLVQRVVDNNQ